MNPDSIKYGELTSSKIHSIHRVKDFVKDRAELEKEFGKKLEQLAKKHLNKNFPDPEMKSKNIE